MPTTIEQKAPLVERFAEAFRVNEGHTLNGANARLQGLRREAITRFTALGLPTRKDEAWKYTDLTPVLSPDYRLQLGPAVAPLAVGDLDAHLLPGLDAYVAVLVNGHFDAASSQLEGLPDGVVVTGLADAAARHADVVDAHLGRYADHQEEALAALNTAFTVDGLFVHVPEGTVLERPLHIVRLLTGDEAVMVQPRSLFVFEARSEARVVTTQHHSGTAQAFTNGLEEVFVGAHANIDLYKVQDEGDQAAQVDHTEVYQQTQSVFSMSTFTFSGKLVRNNVNVLPDAEHCETHLRGLFLPRGSEHVDNHTLMDHARPNCFSNETYKGVLDDRARGVFNGKVLVRQDAQQTNAFQQNKTILLTKDARMNAKPELEIYADDVKCSHGATTGQLDAEALFYLRTRGLSLRQARGLLLLAFARDVLDTVRLPALREALDAKIVARFS